MGIQRHQATAHPHPFFLCFENNCPSLPSTPPQSDLNQVFPPTILSLPHSLQLLLQLSSQAHLCCSHLAKAKINSIKPNKRDGQKPEG